MRACFHCGFGGDKHHAACPQLVSDGGEKAQAYTAWHDGYDHGRSGEKLPANANATHRLGWVEGEAALEATREEDPLYQYLN